MRQDAWVLGSMGVGSLMGCTVVGCALVGCTAPARNEPMTPAVAGAVVTDAPAATPVPAALAARGATAATAALPPPAPSSAPGPGEIDLLLEPGKLEIDSVHRTVQYDVDYRTRSSRHRVCDFDYADWMAKVGDPKGALLQARIRVGARKSSSTNADDDPHAHFDCALVSAEASGKR